MSFKSRISEVTLGSVWNHKYSEYWRGESVQPAPLYTVVEIDESRKRIGFTVSGDDYINRYSYMDFITSMIMVREDNPASLVRLKALLTRLRNLDDFKDDLIRKLDSLEV